MFILKALREHTDEVHQSLHEHPLLKPLTAPTLKIDDYYYALKAFQIYYGTAEKAVRSTVQNHVPNAPVCAWLESDLHNASIDLPIPLALNDFPLLDTSSKLMGYLYVKQGSSLGGQLISKNLQTALGLKPIIDQKFFAAYGSETGAQWQEFMRCLQEMEDDLILDEMLETSLQAFKGIFTTCNEVWKIRNAYTP
jgi:heme oxygenase